jgi:MoaA/NifB/PqqE/SkfB family radical SAM enzyme
VNTHYLSLIQEALRHFYPAFRGRNKLRKIANLVGANLHMAMGIPYRGSPVRLYLHTTNACNLHCIGCARTYRTTETQWLKLDALQEIANSFPLLLSVCLHGEGEPLLYPHIYEAVTLFASRGCWVSFNSNGTLLDEKNVAKLCHAGIAEVNVSLDGARDETIKKTRIGSDPGSIKAGIRRLVTEGKKRNKALLVGISMYININNAGEVEEFIRLGSELDVGYIRFQRITRSGQTSQLSLDRSDETRLFSMLQARGHQSNPRIYIDSFNEFQRERFPLVRSRCPMPWFTMSLGLDGKADPCCSANVGSLGDFHEKTVKGIIDSETRATFMRQLTSRHPPEVCVSCQWLQK